MRGRYQPCNKEMVGCNEAHALRDAFFDGDIALRKVFSESNHFLMSVGQECFNEVVSDVFKKPLDNRLIENTDLRQACDSMGLTVTKAFKKQLETLHYMLELHVS